LNQADHRYTLYSHLGIKAKRPTQATHIPALAQTTSPLQDEKGKQHLNLPHPQTTGCKKRLQLFEKQPPSRTTFDETSQSRCNKTTSTENNRRNSQWY